MEKVTVWIGIDDTDSSRGGCTTFVCFSTVERIIEEGYDIIGFPRLVRLNPNVPWKTRGNGAISFRVGSGRGKTILIGEKGKKKFYAFLRGDGRVNVSVLERIVSEVIEELALVNDKNTNPGFVICKRKLPPYLYWKGVRKVILIDEVKEILKKFDATYKAYGNGRGIIGAAASISWRPKDRTYEIIAYRKRERWGSKRLIDVESVISMDKKFPSTFDNYDYINKVNRIAPNSPCPVLYGIRGGDPDELIRAKDMVKSETPLGWMIFETNQGTDDHLQRKRIKDLEPYESVITKGKVTEKPHTAPGGHVFFRINDGTGTIKCAAFEPTKQFRNVVRELEEGDVVEVYGGVHERPFTINLEKMRIEKLRDILVKVENPVCDRCKKHMKSVGKGKGYRCIKCGSRKKEDAAKFRKLNRKIKEGFYEVPVCARRHLSKPLKRIEKDKPVSMFR